MLSYPRGALAPELHHICFSALIPFSHWYTFWSKAGLQSKHTLASTLVFNPVQPLPQAALPAWGMEPAWGQIHFSSPLPRDTQLALLHRAPCWGPRGPGTPPPQGQKRAHLSLSGCWLNRVKQPHTWGSSRHIQGHAPDFQPLIQEQGLIPVLHPCLLLHSMGRASAHTHRGI